MQADMGIAHFAFKLGLGDQGGDGIDHQHVDRAGADQRIGDFQRLLAGIGLADQQFIHIHAQLARITRVERMLGIDEGAGAARFLRFSDHMQRQRGLA